MSASMVCDQPLLASSCEKGSTTKSRKEKLPAGQGLCSAWRRCTRARPVVQVGRGDGRYIDWVGVRRNLLPREVFVGRGARWAAAVAAVGASAEPMSSTEGTAKNRSENGVGDV